MFDLPFSKIAYVLCSVIGIGLLVTRWIYSGDITGFFVLLTMLIMFILRWRFPKWSYSVVVDAVLCALISPVTLVLALFWAMYYRIYIALLVLIYLFTMGNMHYIPVIALAAIAGFFLAMWENEIISKLTIRDTEAGRFYELQALQADLMTATAQVERMTTISERARIAREIHDNAGHEIVAAYISLQAVRAGLPEGDAAIPLFDTALQRLDTGVHRVREAVHNLAPITTLGITTLEKICTQFPVLSVSFIPFGDTNHVPMYVWNTLEACLNEALTNASRHARPTFVNVYVDTTPNLVRLCVENDGIDSFQTDKSMGAGLRNLRYRTAAVGGSVATDRGDVFKLICVIPL